MRMLRRLRMGRWCPAFILAIISASCTAIEPSPIPATAPFPPATRATTQLGAQEMADGRFIGMAFSGGGSRAAVFGAAVMKELDRVHLLPQVDVLSAVSGGALPAAAYVLEGYRDFSFRNGFAEHIGRDFQRAMLGPWYTVPQNALRYALTDRIPAEQVIQVLDDRLFGGTTFADLNPSKPILLMNATNALTGEPLIISDEGFHSLNQPLASFRIARAVYMSAAYPGVLEPLAIPYRKAGDGSSDQPPLLAYDGGAADNLGIRTLMLVVNDALSAQ
ncbi:MAG: patatin-like phospholipase family protein [Nitrospirota bacterium]|nr:patatin-like phospholipase family protein [Nitrospirota bacterium]